MPFNMNDPLDSEIHRQLHIYAVNDAMLTLELDKAQRVLRRRAMRNVILQVFTFIAIISLVYATCGEWPAVVVAARNLLFTVGKRRWKSRS